MSKEEKKQAKLINQSNLGMRQLLKLANILKGLTGSKMSSFNIKNALEKNGIDEGNKMFQSPTSVNISS